MDDVTPRDCLDRAARIERLAQALYSTLAERTRHWPLLQQLFARLAAEEEQHALRILALSRQDLSEGWDAARAREVVESLGAMEAELERITAEVVGNPALRDSAGILALVSGFESRFATLHAEELAQLFAPEVRRLFAALAAQDLQHVELLEAAPVG